MTIFDLQRTAPVFRQFLRAIAGPGLGILCGLCAISGCTGSATSQLDLIRIGYQKTGTLNLVRLRGALAPDMARLGARVEWIGFPAGPQLLEALNAGAIDFGHSGDAPPIIAQAAGVPFVYVAYEPSRPHSEALIVPAGSPLQTLADLKGKRVALNKGSNVHYLLLRSLEFARVPYDQVETVFLSPSDARAAFEGGSVDAWAVWDPYLAEAEMHAGARLLADANSLVANREFHLASRRMARERPEAVRAIVTAIAREGRWAVDHRDEVVAIFATELGLDNLILQRVIGRKEYGIAAMNEDVLTEQQGLADAFFAIHLIPRPIVVREAIVPDLVAEHPAPVDDVSSPHLTKK
jgi:sulfonate transport system substrate-binding protein